MKQSLLFAFGLAALGASAQSVPQSAAERPMPHETFRPQMRVDKIGNSKFDNADGHDLREVKTEGDYHVPVILVNFSDYKFKQGGDDPRGLINEMLNGSDFKENNATGSVNEFYRFTSRGQFNPIFDVYGPIEVSGKEADYVYAKYNSRPDKRYYELDGVQIECEYPGVMVEEAVKQLDDQIDFSKYDSNGDGFVDFIYFFHAGKGATTGGSVRSTIWPHAFTLTGALGAPMECDGVKVNRYATSSELGADNRLSGIGTFCHEFGHVLGLPDLYETTSNGSGASKSFTPGSFDCMDSGNYNNNEHTPPVFSSYEQYALEWLKPVELTGGGDFTMIPLSHCSLAYKVKTSVPTEYFLLEARTNQSYDTYLEGHGLAIWHIDYDDKIWPTPNNQALHQRVDLIEADNEPTTSTRHGDLFPGTAGQCEYLQNVTPTFVDWANKPVGVELERITRNIDGTVSFHVKSANEMEGVRMDAPKPRVVGAGANSLYLEWSEVDGAEKYMVSLFPSHLYKGGVVEHFQPGYIFKEVSPEIEDGLCSVTLDGLNGDMLYGVFLYALGEKNASRTSEPLYAATVAGNSRDFSRTNIYPENLEGKLALDWDPVEGAVRYEVSVMTRTPGEDKFSVKAGFNDGKLGEGWSAKGKYSSRDKFFGETAPSLNFTANGDYLASPEYDGQVKTLKFWARRRFNEDLCSISVYGDDIKQGYVKVAEVKDLTTEGKIHEIAFPAGCKGVKLIYNFQTTGLDAYIDDVELTFTDTFADTPAGLPAEFDGDTRAVVAGLDPEVEYIAYVTPEFPEGPGARSYEATFRISSLRESGIEEVAATETVKFHTDGLEILSSNPTLEFNVYSIDGAHIAKSKTGKASVPAKGLYVITCETAKTKIIL